VHLPHTEIMPLLKVGDKVFINDGLVRLEVTKKNPDSVVCKVIAGGVVSSKKGLNLPTLEVPMAALTPKDKKDLAFGLELGVDWVALSFVQRKEDIEELAAIVKGRARIMAKIEMPSGVKRLDEIIPLVDACMVARGDLGVELPLEEVPPIQKRIIRLCREAGKIVVVATQMLESMTQNASPTRAEVSDVANATYEGADVLMLSAESASGKYPVEAVATMDAIIRRVEQSSAWQPLVTARQLTNGQVEDAITSAAANLADAVKATAIVTFTSSGTTALRMSRQRPAQPIMVLTPFENTARGLVLAWGVHTEVVPDVFDMDKMIDSAADKAHSRGIAQKGDHIVVTAGMPIGTPGTTNMVRVREI
jgi:pyruvate kinase